ncbi:MAG: SLBB domain-containing protein [Proteobacteria bacterium]|nr:SLBB domain-containing protein [Pseudomonadota bacterium]
MCNIIKKLKIYLLSSFIFFISGINILAQQTADFSGSNPNQLQIINISPDLNQPSNTNITPEQLKNISPEQRKSAQEIIQQKGLTPEAVEAIKNMPEFQGLTLDEVIKGKEELESKSKETVETEKKKEEINKVEMEKDLEDILFKRFRDIQGYQTIKKDLKPFGYEFFKTAGSRIITDRRDMPVPGKYVVGPGDEIRILMWGRINAQYNLVIDRNGNITIPNIGPIQISGLTYDQMVSLISKRAEEIVGTNISITMGNLKSIPIFVLGDVRKPGAYNIGSFATITDALLIAGGPNNIGSMRNVQLKRRDKVVAVFDLYDLLLKGDKSQDKILQAGDVIFVPVAGPIVGIVGNVKRPAIYELKEGNTLNDLIELAGGILPTGYTQQIQVERIIKNERQIIIDIDDKNLEKSKNFKLEDGDLINIFNIVEKDINVVYLYGNVKKQGKYEYKIGMRLKDIIKDANDLLPETYFDYALIKRLALPDLRTELVPFNLEKAILSGNDEHNIELKPQDIIYVFNKWFFKDKPIVTIQGEVRKAGKFAIMENTTIRDVIALAGGLTRLAYMKQGELIRVTPSRDYKTIYFNLEKVISGDPNENIKVQDEDRIIIHSINEEKYKQVVFISGEVLKPGEYQYTEGMTVRDLIFKAGNLLESAYLEEAEISSQVIENNKIVKIDHKKINLAKALMDVREHNILLKPYDRIFIKRLSDWRKEEYATISGEVLFPGRYILKKGEKISSLIERAGGYTKNAYLRGAIFTRKSVKELQQKSLDEMIAKLERELLAEGAISASTSVSQEEITAKKVELESKKRFIDSLKKFKATGRMSIKLAHLRLLKNSEYDIELEDGDSLYIPAKSSVVTVTGSVMSQTSVIYSEKYVYMDYINLAGGFSRFADKDNVYILKVDGTAKRISKGWINWNSIKSRWELSSFGEEEKEIEPGDTIVVPEKLDRIAWLREIKDITQILMQMAVTAGVVINLF